MLRFLGMPLQSIAMKRKVSTDLSEYDEVKIIRGQIPEIAKASFLFRKLESITTRQLKGSSRSLVADTNIVCKIKSCLLH